MVTSTQTLVSFLSISETKDETVTRGKSYKFDLLKQSIIRALWEIGHNFTLKNQNYLRPMAFKGGFRRLP